MINEGPRLQSIMLSSLVESSVKLRLFTGHVRREFVEEVACAFVRDADGSGRLQGAPCTCQFTLTSAEVLDSDGRILMWHSFPNDHVCVGDTVRIEFGAVATATAEKT